MVYNPCDWWCDMAALERAAVYWIANNFNFDEYWVTQADFNILWVLAGGTVADLRYNAFIDYYRLTPGEIIGVDDEPIAVYLLEPDTWFSFLAWFLEHGFLCPGAGIITAWPDVGYTLCED